MKTNILIKKATLLLIFLFLQACTCESRYTDKDHSEMSAEDVVKAYLETVFNITNFKQKEDLMHLTTGELRSSLAQADEETFKTAYMLGRYKLKEFAILNRRDRTPKAIDITYELKYVETSAADKTEAFITTENTVSLLQEDDDKWYISEVVGNITSMEFPDIRSTHIKPEKKEIKENTPQK